MKNAFQVHFITHIIPLVQKIKMLNYFLRISNDFRLVKESQEKKNYRPQPFFDQSHMRSLAEEKK